ncbi:MAG: HU family DNA-binding protein [Gammaproteobacteria bacterium]
MPAKKKPAKSAARKKTVKKAVKKPAAKKTAAKKVVKKTTKKAAAPRKAKTASIQVLKAAPAVKSPFTKTELTKTISDMTGLSSKEVKSVMEALENVIHEHIKSRGPQLFSMGGLIKVKVIRKPATKARKGINPFTGEPTTFKAKPARNVVKVLALKKLKEMAK